MSNPSKSQDQPGSRPSEAVSPVGRRLLELGRRGKIKSAAAMGVAHNEEGLEELERGLGENPARPSLVRLDASQGRATATPGFDLLLIGRSGGGPAVLETAQGARYVVMLGIAAPPNAELFRRLAGDRRYLLREADAQMSGGFALFEQVYKDAPESIAYEQGEWRMVLQRVKPGMTVFDIGANVGDYAILFSRLVGDEGRVFAFEPATATTEKLTRRMGAHACDNVRIFKNAVYSKNTKLQFNEFPEEFSAWNSLGTPQMAHPRDPSRLVPVEKTETVNAVRLDDFCKQNGVDVIHFMKLDVEGAESEALLGAEQFLARKAIRFLQFEISQAMLQGMNKRAREVFEILERHGYECHRIGPDGSLGPVAKDSDAFYANYAAFPRLCVHFFTIVLNGEPYIRHHVEQFKKLSFDWHWHVVEGVARLVGDTAWSVPNGGHIPGRAHSQGLSTDGTTRYLDQLVRELPERVSVYRKSPGEFWNGKLEMVSKPLDSIAEDCLLWEIDADELWTAEQFEAGRKLFLDDPGKTAAMYWCWMFVGPDLVSSTRNCYANNPQMEWLRTWRYRPGMRWAAHEPPVLAEQMPSGQWRAVAQVNPILHDRTEGAGLVFQHYAYATEKQVRFKQDYYGYRSAVHKWRALQRATNFPVVLRDFFAWVGDETQVDLAEFYVAERLMPPERLVSEDTAAGGGDERERLRDRVYQALYQRSNKQRVYSIIRRLTPDRWLVGDLSTFEHASNHETAWFDSVTLLNWCAHFLRPATYLEVGVRRGRSMAQVLVESPQTRGFGFDLWIPGYAHVDNPGPEVAISEFGRVGVKRLPRMTSGDSHRTVPAFFADPANPREIDLIFIDGDHTYEGAKADLDVAFSHLAPGGVLAFDDITHPSHPELQGLWDEYKARFGEYLFVEDPRPTGIGAAFKPPFDKLIRALEESEGAADEGVKSPPRVEVAGASEMPRPRVVIDGVFFQMFNTGIARVWKTLLERWARDGFGGQVLVLDRVGTAPKVEGIRSRVVPAYDYNATAADREMLQGVCDEEGADVFASTYYTTPVTTPQLFMIHDMIPEVFGWDLRHAMWREKHEGIRRASGFVAVSEATKRDFLRFFPEVSSERVTVTHLAASKVFWARDAAEVRSFREKFGISRPYFLIVGARGGYKNTILSFRGLSRLGEGLREFDVVCTGGGVLEPEYAALVPADRVRVIARLTDEELAAAYGGAVGLLHPSTYEGFGLPVLEAMACGCPVITTRNGSLAEVAGEAAIFVGTEDVEGMTAALREVVKEDVRKELSRAGLEQAKRFSWERTAWQVREALEKVGALSPRLPP